MDFLQELGLQILVPLVSALVTAGVAFLVARISQTVAEMKDRKVAHHLMIAIDTIAAAVEMVNQTFVDDLKNSGRFDGEAARQAFEKSLSRTHELLPEQTKTVLGGAYKDLDLWIKTKTEEFVSESNKNREIIRVEDAPALLGGGECERQ